MEWMSDLVARRRISRQIRGKAVEALERSDLREILQIAGAEAGNEEAHAALKAILADKIMECTIRAMREAKKRGIRFGASAIVIAASKAK